MDKLGHWSSKSKEIIMGTRKGREEKAKIKRKEYNW